MTSLAEAAILWRSAIKDKSYQGTPLGGLVARYLHWKEVEDRAAPRTLRDYEATLARLALFYADRDPATLTRDDVRDFWYTCWKTAEPATRRKVLAHLRDFFKWATDDAATYETPPTQGIRTPKAADSEIAELFSDDDRERLFAYNPRSRDQAALALLFHLALRRTALRLFQLGDYDAERASARFHWKGGRLLTLPVPLGVAAHLDRHVAVRMAEVSSYDYRSEYLLSPERWTPTHRRDGPRMKLAWQEPCRPLSETAIHNWWARCLERAGIAHRRLHDARHTALTDFHRAHGDLRLTQLLAGHKSVQTTQRYAHVSATDLADALRRMEQS